MPWIWLCNITLMKQIDVTQKSFISFLFWIFHILTMNTFVYHNKVNFPLQWLHNGNDGVSNHQPHHCLLNRLFRHRSKKTSKLCITGLCEGNSLVTSEFPEQRPVTQKMFPLPSCYMHFQVKTVVSLLSHVWYFPIYQCLLDFSWPPETCVSPLETVPVQGVKWYSIVIL